MKFKLSILLIVVVISSGCSNYFSAHKNGGFQSNSKKIIAKGSLKKDSDLLISIQKENREIEENLRQLIKKNRQFKNSSKELYFLLRHTICHVV